MTRNPARVPLTRRELIGAGLALVGVSALSAVGCAPAATPTPTVAPKPTEPAKPAAAPTAAPAAKPAEAPTAAAKPTEAAAAKPAPGKQVQLQFLWVTRPGEEALWKEVFPKLLEKYHPNIKVAIETVPASGSYWDQLLTKVISMTAAGTPPDGSRNAGYNARQLAKNGLFRNIMDYANTDKYPFDSHFRAAFPPHLKTPDGKLNGLPVSILTVVRYVNKELLAKSGLQPPSDWTKGNWTLPQMLENSKKLTQGEGASKVYGMRMQMNAMHGSHWFWADGAEILDAEGKLRITEPGAVEVLQYGLEYFKQKISPSPTDLQAVPLVTMFTSGRLAMMDLSQSSIPTVAQSVKFDWGVMPTSVGKSGKSFAVQFVDFWYVHNKSKNPEETYQAIEVLNREEFETAMVQNKTGGIPTLKGVAERLAKEVLYVDSNVSLDSLNVSREPYYAVNQVQWQSVVDKNMDLLWLGKVTPKECAENIVKEATPVLADDKM